MKSAECKLWISFFFCAWRKLKRKAQINIQHKRTDYEILPTCTHSCHVNYFIHYSLDKRKLDVKCKQSDKMRKESDEKIYKYE